MKIWTEKTPFPLLSVSLVLLITLGLLQGSVAHSNSCVELMKDEVRPFSEENLSRPAHSLENSSRPLSDFEKILLELKKLPEDAPSGAVMSFLNLKLRSLSDKLNQSIQLSQFQTDELRSGDGQDPLSLRLQTRMVGISNELTSLNNEFKGKSLENLKKEEVERLKQLQSEYKAILDLQKDFDEEVVFLIQAKEQIQKTQIELEKLVSTLDQLLEQVMDKALTPEFSSPLRSTLMEHILTKVNSLSTQSVIVSSLENTLMNLETVQNQVRKNLMDFSSFPLISKFFKEIAERNQKEDLEVAQKTDYKRELQPGEKAGSIYGKVTILSSNAHRDTYTVRFWSTHGPKIKELNKMWVGNTTPGTKTFKGISVGDKVYIRKQMFRRLDYRTQKAYLSRAYYEGSGRVIGITNTGDLIVRFFRPITDTLLLARDTLRGTPYFNYVNLRPEEVELIKKK